MNTGLASPGPTRVVSSLDAAAHLQRELNHLGIPSDVHDGYGLALVSVWVGLVVWCDCERYWWRTGWDPGRKRAIYAWHPILEPARAAGRVARRYADVRQSHRWSNEIADVTHEVAQSSKTA
ncbi:hypothetical protein [Nonomuraea rhodomycinica]|uniref:Uncharacterized protein n=1 Tax=Nonomuraea rhodomycinica TaxID=1712872 RepID=A0A7Y6IVJ6_9ACTN|nr:hypothetical protein [Nonomuraea rhodomycinica]NUW44863.1 hypothetical protein [Nonomuraea rhodomycinica]